MSGPIVRTGTNPKFWEGWDKVFGDKKAAPAKTTKTPEQAAAPVKKAVAKKATAKKAAAKKKA